LSQVKTNTSFLYIAALICLIAVSLFTFSKSSFFAVENIRFIGLDNVREDEVLRLIGIVNGENMFLVDTETLAQKAELHPLIDSADVAKELPSTLVFKIQERLPVALILAKDGLVEVDRQGTLLRFHDTWPEKDCPILTGVEVPETLGPGQKLSNASLDKGLKLLEQAPANLLSIFGEVNIAEDGQVYIYLTTGKKVLLGFNEDYKAKLELLNELLNSEEYKQIEKAYTYIDLKAGKPVLGL
jgi:cell division protein FtsQ